MKYLFYIFGIVIVASTSIAAQTITANSIMEQDTLDTSAPCTYCSTWRFARQDSTLYRWSVANAVWERYSGTRTFEIASTADTASIVAPIQGDLAITSSNTMLIYSTSWLIFSGSGGGGSDQDSILNTYFFQDTLGLILSSGDTIKTEIVGSAIDQDSIENTYFLQDTLGLILNSGDTIKTPIEFSLGFTANAGSPFLLTNGEFFNISGGWAVVTVSDGSGDVEVRLDTNLLATRAHVTSITDTLTTADGTVDHLAIFLAQKRIGTITGLSIDESNKIFQLPSEWALDLPGGTTAQRPAGQEGRLYYNTDSRLQFHNGTAWYNLSPFRRFFGIEWIDETPKFRLGGDGMQWYPGTNQSNTNAFGVGFQCGVNSTGSNTSFAAGSYLGRENNASLVSGGAGYFMLYQNTGVYASAGAGAYGMRQNSGLYCSLGAGGFGLDGNTGDYVSGLSGFRVLEKNTGDRVTAGGAGAMKHNAGDDVVGIGVEAGDYNTGSRNVFVGNYAGGGYKGNDAVFIGHNAGKFVRDQAKLDTIILNEISGNILTLSPLGDGTSKWGNVGDFIALQARNIGSANFSPLSLLQFEIISATQIELSSNDVIAYTSNSEKVELASGVTFINSVAIGSDASVDGDNQVAVGNSQAERIKLGPIDLGTSNAENITEKWLYAYSEADSAFVPSPADTTNSGELYTTSNIALSGTGTWTHVTGFSPYELRNFTGSSSTLTYTGADTKKFLVQYSGAVDITTAGSSSGAFDCMIYKNAVQSQRTRSKFQIHTSAAQTWIGSLSGQEIIELETNDTIRLYYTATTGTNTYDILYFNLTITEL